MSGQFSNAHVRLYLTFLLKSMHVLQSQLDNLIGMYQCFTTVYHSQGKKDRVSDKVSNRVSNIEYCQT